MKLPIEVVHAALREAGFKDVSIPKPYSDMHKFYYVSPIAVGHGSNNYLSSLGGKHWHKCSHGYGPEQYDFIVEFYQRYKRAKKLGHDVKDLLEGKLK